MGAGPPRIGVGPGFDSQGSVTFFHKYCFPNLYWIHWVILGKWFGHQLQHPSSWYSTLLKKCWIYVSIDSFEDFLVDQDRQFQNTPNSRVDSFRFFWTYIHPWAKVPKMVLNRSGIGYSGPDFFVMPLLRLISPMWHWTEEYDKSS